MGNAAVKISAFVQYITRRQVHLIQPASKRDPVKRFTFSGLLDETRDDNKENRDEENGEKCTANHTAENPGTNGMLRAVTCATGQH